MPEGDDEIGGHVWRSGAPGVFWCEWFRKWDWISDVSTIQTLDVRPHYPFMGRGFVDYSGQC